MKLTNIEIEGFEFLFRQYSDSSYRVITRVKNFRSSDLRETHQADAVIHIIDRHHIVQPDAYMLIASLDYEPKTPISSIPTKNGNHFSNLSISIFSYSVNIQLESLYICIKVDYLLSLRDFFIFNLPKNDKKILDQEDSIPITTSSSNKNDTETHVGYTCQKSRNSLTRRST